MVGSKCVIVFCLQKNEGQWAEVYYVFCTYKSIFETFVVVIGVRTILID